MFCMEKFEYFFKIHSKPCAFSFCELKFYKLLSFRRVPSLTYRKRRFRASSSPHERAKTFPYKFICDVYSKRKKFDLLDHIWCCRNRATKNSIWFTITSIEFLSSSSAVSSRCEIFGDFFSFWDVVEKQQNRL
jgi:hypothetical protein